MNQVHCENVSEGMRASEALVTLLDCRGKRHSIRVERDFLSERSRNTFLPIGIVHVDYETKSVLSNCLMKPKRCQSAMDQGRSMDEI